MKARTIISYVPGEKKKPKKTQKKGSFRGRFSHYIKGGLILFFFFMYLVYTNQSSTLGYSLRKSLRDLERTQEQYDSIQLLVSQKEQQLRSQVERKSSREKTKKMYIE